MTRFAHFFAAATLGFAALGTVHATEPERLRIIDEDTQFIIKRPTGNITITRTMTACAKNKGWLQPLVPIEGVHPVTETEVLHALNDPQSVVVDMRVVDDYVKGTIPGAMHIPYTEMSMRLNELGCNKTGQQWNCSTAKKVYAFCNGPVCPQSPIAIKAMVRDGFPAEKIYYYRGGMLDWDALGLTSVKCEL
jgi:rhodanese-related sulfurtransferase